MSNQRYTDALLANGRLREERDQLLDMLATVPIILNKAFSAGMEEREGGDINRQKQLMKSVNELRAVIHTALTKEPRG